MYFEALEPRLLLSADLAAGSLSYSTTSAPIVPGEALSARFTVDRLGDEVSATQVRFYASTDRTLDATDTLLGRRDLAAGTLHPGANPIVVDLDSHAFSSPGRYTLIGVVDPDDRVPESDETNNQALSSSPFEVAFTVGQIPGRSPVPALELTDADGTRFTLAISGPGSASLLPEAGGYRLTVSGNDATTRITLTGSGGDGRLTLSGLEVERALGSLSAPLAVLTGSARFTQINTLSVASIDAGARLQGAALANLTVSGDARGEVRLSGAGATGFVLGTAQIGGTLAGLWAIDGRANSVSAQTTAADWRANFRAPLTQLVVRGDASGQLAAAALQLLQVGGSLRGMTVRIGADLGSDAALGGSGEAADTFRAGTLARLRVTGDIDNSVILVGLDPRNGTDFDGDDQVLGSASAYRIQELLVGGRLTGETRIVAPAFPDSVRVNGALVSPASLSQLSVTAPDRQAPLLSAALANDTGASASDRLTCDPTIAGTLTETGGGRRLWASFATSPSSFVDVSSALLPDGHFVLDAARLAAIQGAALPEGAHTLRLVAEDAAGNRSPTVSVNFTLDTTAPAAPGLDLLATSDSGVRDDDELTRDTTPTLRLTAEDGSAIVLRREGDPTPWSLTGPVAEFTSPPLADGAQVFRASATDRAGNVGETATLALAIDSEAPALMHLGLDPDADTGAIGDLQTQAAVIALVGRTAPGTSVRLLDPAKTSTADGTGDFRLADLPLAVGDNAFEVVLADAAGNETNGALVVTRLVLPTDTTAPTLSAALLADTGASASDGLTNDARFAGTASDDVGVGQLLAQLDPATPDALFTDVTTLLATDESFTLTRATLDALAGGTLADGAHTLRFVAVDAAGNRSDVLERQFTLDTAAPAFTGFGLSLSDATNAALDETSAATVQLKGNAEAGATIRLDAQDIEVLAGAGGAFVLPSVALALGANDLTLTASDAAGNTTSFDRTLSRNAAVQADAVLEWNAIARRAVQLDVTDPPVATRTLAMVSLAQYDALAAIEGTPAYLVSRSVSGSVSAPAAVAVAAHRVLSQIYPAQQAVFDGALAADLAALADGPAKDQGIALGLAIADAVLALRAHDGAEDFVAYDGSTALGQWRPTGPMYDVADEPQWATVQPFALRSPDQFRPIAPPALDTAAYAAAVEEVKRLGSATGSARSADQTEQALFWADGKGSYTPPGHWNQIAEEVARNQGNSLSANARLFAQLNVALADAAIAAWDAKYNYGLWRPETAIQNADLDNNDATTVEAAWRPLLITPPHPEYVSGHSTFSAAAAGILAATFGDATAFSTTSATLPGVSRSFTSFTQAAQEAGRSRIYGGIHYEFTNQTGQQLGTQVAEAVLARFALTSDTQAPAIVLDDSPAATNANLTLTGQVLDHLSGVASAQFQVDDGALQALVLDARGGFTIPTAFATDGSADG
ncbi:MAG: Ig-like domain-containing protein, partial [Candidatus Accumulibacter sp.]|uniref:Ig-like domain-containing protein n=1 Tax=Accumulibacter sp. TaxID=2053492 RepID=UPI00258ED373